MNSLLSASIESYSVALELRSVSKIKLLFHLFLFLFLYSIKIQVYAGDHHAVIINPSVGEKTLSANSLRSIYGMHQKTWPDGSKIRVFVLPDDDPLHQGFVKEILNVFPYQLRSTWDRLIFSGTGQAPTKVHSSQEMFQKVSTTPGAIGYLWRAEINGGVNVLQIK